MLKRCISGLLLSFSLNSTAQTLLSDTVKQLQSRDWMKRAEAVQRFQSHPEWLDTSDARRVLLELLAHENHGDAKPRSGFGVTGSEGHAEYYADVLGLVDSFVDSSDQHAVMILAHSVYNADSEFAIKLSSYGETVVAPLLVLSRHEDPGRDVSQRANAYETLGNVLRAQRRGLSRHPLSAHTVALVETRLHEGLHDLQPYVRVGAIRAVAAAGDVDMLPMLEQLARTDPQSATMDNGIRRYFVREEATSAIAVLKQTVQSR
jgi:hypothetical protein